MVAARAVNVFGCPQQIFDAMKESPGLPLFRAAKILGPLRMQWGGDAAVCSTGQSKSTTSWLLDGAPALFGEIMKAAGLPENLGVREGWQ
tara:strand:- start:51 stop:320 length:270 start_codon:yes stop_codon:yes gene_type:complete